MIVDAHQHFWNPMRGDYGWLQPGDRLYRTFGPDDLAPLRRAAGVDGTILVQAAPTETESDYLLDITRRTPWVLGVVGWITLDAADAEARVKTRAADPLFLGVRPMLQDIAQRDWILRPELERGLNAVAEASLVFDALALSDQIGVVEELARRFPRLSIVLDHGAKPKLGNASAMAQWRADMTRLAARPNVTCKLSGLLTELPAGVPVSHLRDAANALFDIFGGQRLIWGSDWPVLTNASTYPAWIALAREIVAAHNAIDAVMGGNALRIYRPTRAAAPVRL